MEEARAIQGLGKYRLSPGYNHFQQASVSPLYLSKGSRSSQLQVIIKYTPKVLFTIVRYSVRPCNQEVDTIQHVQMYIHILRM